MQKLSIEACFMVWEGLWELRADPSNAVAAGQARLLVSKTAKGINKKSVYLYLCILHAGFQQLLSLRWQIHTEHWQMVPHTHGPGTRPTVYVYICHISIVRNPLSLCPALQLAEAEETEEFHFARVTRDKGDCQKLLFKNQFEDGKQRIRLLSLPLWRRHLPMCWVYYLNENRV